ncbi:hypothetical protein [Planococcus dechangensis]|uniref:Uncharacterized protein n=1 Tax=Planococcus dechangensis TaxID=1176255 RepID=A0ABV9MCS4_9BACL
MAKGQETTVQQIVSSHYVNDKGVIHAYPDDEKSEYLSESIGLYMQYLLQINDEQEFRKQVEILQNQFLVKVDDRYFVPWRVYENAKVNALIDDIRIAAVLDQAAQTFNEPDFGALAKQIRLPIESQQHQEGIAVDYYDWSYGLAGKRVTLSYLIEELTINTDSFNLLKLEKDQLFFPEYYDFEKERYMASDEVHMIDQLLIAINRFDQDIRSPEFDSWLLAEWEERGMLAGRFNRETGTPTVEYESLAVYYYLWQYLERIGKPELAKEAFKQAELVIGEEVPGELHFFDFIHYQMMVAAQ